MINSDTKYICYKHNWYSVYHRCTICFDSWMDKYGFVPDSVVDNDIDDYRSIES